MTHRPATTLVLLLLLPLLLLQGCTKNRPAPVRVAYGPPLASEQEPSRKRIPRSRTGHYVVQPGDTLYAIAVVHELDPEELAAWNGIKEADLLFVGQNLRLSTSRDGAAPGATATQPAGPLPAPGTPPRLVAGERSTPPATHYPDPAEPAVVAEGGGSDQPVESPPIPESTPARHKVSASPPGQWQWPHGGRIIQTFGKHGQTRSTGIDIAVRRGDRVRAAADGVVAYADDGLPGYGNLVILRHGGSYMTAYAHNDTILVKRGEAVRAGQEIAKAGQSGRVSSPRLHFELRKGVTPVDPLRHLPRRNS